MERKGEDVNLWTGEKKEKGGERDRVFNGWSRGVWSVEPGG